MWKKKLLNDLFLPVAFTATTLLEACSGTAIPTIAPTPTKIIHPNIPATSTNTPITEIVENTSKPTHTPTPSPTSTPTLTPTNTPSPTPTRQPGITKEEAHKIKSEISANAEKKVFAIYLDWFGQSNWTEWAHWEWTGKNPHDPRKFVDNGKRDIASVNYPFIGPYRSNDPELVRYHTKLAKSLGIDALVVDWYTYKDTPNTDLAYMDRNFSLVMDIAEQESYQLSVIMEPKIHFNGWVPHSSRSEAIEAVRDDFRYVLDKYSKRKSFLKQDGLPVIFVYDTIQLNPEEWSSVVRDLENEGYYFVMIGDITDPRYLGPFSSLYEWPNYDGVVKEGEPYHSKILDNLNRTTKGRRDVVPAAAVWPGFNDTGVWGWDGGPRVLERRAGEFYRSTWDASFNNNSKWIAIATFNDWNEGTQIEPSCEHGFEYAEATASFINKFKGTNIDPSKALNLTRSYIESSQIISACK